MNPITLGISFSTCDEDEKRFDRFLTELERLKLQFCVNFDHCSDSTKVAFKDSPYYLDGYADDDPNSFFDEATRNNCLNLLKKHSFDYMLQMDVDETLEKEAPDKIPEILQRMTYEPIDIVDCRVLDLWGDDKHYRVDSIFGSSHREKFFALKRGSVKYVHPTCHAPRSIPRDRSVILKQLGLWVVHWGTMSNEDWVFHTKRWDTIYTRKVGANPYAAGTYAYVNDPNTVPVVADFDYDTWSTPL